jgi:hypothetical protein
MRPLNLRLYAVFALLLLGAWGIFAQETPIVVEETTTLTLQADTPLQVQLTGKTGDVVRVVAVGGEAIDTTLTLLNGDDKIAYADDTLVNGEVVRDATLLVRWQDDSTYTLLIDSFNGVSEGEVTLQVERFGSELQLRENEPLVASLVEGNTLRLLYTAETAQTVLISVRDVGGTLDPLVRVYDANGQLLVLGDDNTVTDGRFNTLDTEVAVMLPVGEVILELSDFLGRAGELEILVESAP